MLRIATVLVLWLFLCGVSYGEGPYLVELGIRGGLSVENVGIPPSEKEDFKEHEVFAVINLPWSRLYDQGWELRTRLNVSAGVLHAAGDSGFISTLTPGLALSRPDWPVRFDVGAGGALISDFEFGRQDIGGTFQFILHGGVSYLLGDHLTLGWQFRHMSDAGIHGTNRGVDLHMFVFGYRF